MNQQKTAAYTSERRVRIVAAGETAPEGTNQEPETEDAATSSAPPPRSGFPPMVAEDFSAGYRALLEVIGDAVLIADFESAQFLHANRAAESLLGYSSAEFSQMTGRDLHPLEQQHVPDSISRELNDSGRCLRPEVLLQRKDGSTFWGELRIGAYHESGTRRYAVIIRDVSDRVEHEREMERARRELEQAHAERLHSNKLIALGQIAAGVAHEVNNPASYVLMNLDEMGALLDRGSAAFRSLRSGLLGWLEGEPRQLAEETLASSPFQSIFREGADLLSECVEGVQRITSLVRDLRGFARIDESDIELVSINDVVVTACKMVGPNIRQRAMLSTRLESRQSLPADRRRLVQVITNLLVNAGQALEEGQADQNDIHVETIDEDECVVVRVSDSGPGIDEDVIERIFEPFFTTKRARGTGLGLSLCSDIVRQHSGSIGAFSTPGRGSVFEVRLPFANGLHIDTSPRAAPDQSVEPGARVLVIDDEAQLLRAYRRILGRHHEVRVACGGAAGLALLESDPRFDVIVCDLMMPEVDGVSIYRALERIAPHLRSRIVFSSGGAFTRRAEELLESIENEFLPKPVDPLDLLDAIERVRRTRRSESQIPVPSSVSPK